METYKKYYRGWVADWLRGVLGNGMILYADLKELAAKEGIPSGTLYSAADKLGVSRVRDASDRKKYWVLDLPENGKSPETAIASAEEASRSGLRPFKTMIGDEETDVVNARDLHAWVRSGHEFANWFKLRCTQGMLVENQDFGVFEGSLKNSKGGRPRIDYAVTVDAAMHMAMLEQTEFGRQVRQDLIDWKKRAKAMERSKVAPVVDALNDPSSLRTLLLGYTERVISLEGQVSHQALMIEQRTAEVEAERAKVVEISEHVEKLSTEVVGYRKFMESDAEVLISDAARMLNVPQGFLFDFLQGPNFKNRNQGIRWIFRRGKGGYSPYKEVRGTYVVLKEGVLKGITRSDGSPVYTEQCRITPHGMTYLSKLFSILKIDSNGRIPDTDTLFDNLH